MNIIRQAGMILLICVVTYFVLGRPDHVLPILLGGISGWVVVNLFSRFWTSKQ
ncbi:hypothetical protein [Halobacillus halophilus]|uniref:hypothetical protein n=1 Tax=Halobacillus halophilus TaxID=1570 RepID=UPI0002E3F3D5|nr:hypothetical protein [Halobacillus halophilus]